jgi:hypothetical protein
MEEDNRETYEATTYTARMLTFDMSKEATWTKPYPCDLANSIELLLEEIENGPFQRTVYSDLAVANFDVEVLRNARLCIVRALYEYGTYTNIAVLAMRARELFSAGLRPDLEVSLHTAQEFSHSRMKDFSATVDEYPEAPCSLEDLSTIQQAFAYGMHIRSQVQQLIPSTRDFIDFTLNLLQDMHERRTHRLIEVYNNGRVYGDDDNWWTALILAPRSLVQAEAVNLLNTLAFEEHAICVGANPQQIDHLEDLSIQLSASLGLSGDANLVNHYAWALLAGTLISVANRRIPFPENPLEVFQDERGVLVVQYAGDNLVLAPVYRFAPDAANRGEI